MNEAENYRRMPEDMVDGDIYQPRNFNGGTVLCTCDCACHTRRLGNFLLMSAVIYIADGRRILISNGSIPVFACDGM